jgi:hypothetical protein
MTIIPIVRTGATVGGYGASLFLMALHAANVKLVFTPGLASTYVEGYRREILDQVDLKAVVDVVHLYP